MKGGANLANDKLTNADVGTEEDTYYDLDVVLLYIHICPCGCEDVCRLCILWSRLLRWTAGPVVARWNGTPQTAPEHPDRVPCETRDAARVWTGTVVCGAKRRTGLGGGKVNYRVYRVKYVKAKSLRRHP